MGRILTFTNSKVAQMGVRKKTVKREIVIGPNAIKFITLTIFAILALVYLSQSTEGANRSVKVTNTLDKKAELELKKERLEVEKVRLESLNQIDQNIQQPTMEPVSSVDHLKENNGLAINN